MKKAVLMMLVSACLTVSLVGCASGSKDKDTQQASGTSNQVEITKQQTTGGPAITVGEPNGKGTKDTTPVSSNPTGSTDISKQDAITQLDKTMDSLDKSLGNAEQQLNLDESALQ